MELAPRASVVGVPSSAKSWHHWEFLPAALQSDNTTPLHRFTMPAPIYSRFVPLKPAIKDAVSASSQPVASPKPAQPKKEKKSKKHTDHELAQRIEEPETASNSAQATVRDAADSSPKSDKKPKKRKRDPVVDDADEEAEAGSKKHKSILSKFEKVSKKAEEYALKRQEAGEDSDDEPAKEQPVLRGRSHRTEQCQDT